MILILLSLLELTTSLLKQGELKSDTRLLKLVKKIWVIIIDLTLSPGINNLTVKTREIKTRHKTIEIDIENMSDKNRSHTPHFRTQDASWNEWCKITFPSLLTLFS